MDRILTGVITLFTLSLGYLPGYGLVWTMGTGCLLAAITLYGVQLYWKGQLDKPFLTVEVMHPTRMLHAWLSTTDSNTRLFDYYTLATLSLLLVSTASGVSSHAVDWCQHIDQDPTTYNCIS